jgi:hypothetical protein
MNDDERRLWVLNNEGLYLDMVHSHQGETKYIRTHRPEIDAVINRELNKEPDK